MTLSPGTQPDSKLTQFARAIGLLLITILLSEAILHVTSLVFPLVGYTLLPPWEWSQPLPDDALVYRGNPYHPEHDDKGYRNDRVLEYADVVTLGDSQTYGVGVAPSASWPRLVSAQAGYTVYNMAFSGYSPAQSYLQLESVLELKPRYVIVSVYLGNDFVDCYKRARANSKIRE